MKNGAYLTFSSDEDFTIHTWFDMTDAPVKTWDGTLLYSTDAKEWSEWDYQDEISSVNGKLYLKGLNNTKITGDYYQPISIRTEAPISCTGNIEVLLDYQKVENGEHPEMAEYCFSELFANCYTFTETSEFIASLIKAPKLPATTLSASCYYRMFNDCSALTEAPELPATNLAEGCYLEMFDSTPITTVKCATAVAGHEEAEASKFADDHDINVQYVL